MNARCQPDLWCGLATIVAMILHFCPSGCSGHPISVTETYVYVTREHTSAKVDVFLEDLFLFHNLQPNSADFLDSEEIGRGIELHKKFVAQRFLIQDVEGRTLRPNGLPAVKADIPREGVPLADLMAHRLTFEMSYEPHASPEFLTFVQRFTDEDGVLPSEMQLRVKQENASTPLSKTLVPDAPHTVRFSWNNPPLSPEASQEEGARWLQKQQEETLGITSYGSVYSFLYIEDYEVRHEILIPLLTLEQSLPIAREAKDFLDIAEQDAVRPRIEAYFASGNPIEIDGQPYQPIVQRCDFYGLNFKDFALQADRKQVSMASGRVGVILSYPLDAAPSRLQLTWNRFNKSLWSINMVVFTPDKPMRTTLSRIAGKNVYNWASPGHAERPSPKQVAAQHPTLPTLPLLPICLLLAIPAVLLIMQRCAASRIAWGVTGGLLLVMAALVWQWQLGSIRMPLGWAAALPAEEADAIFAQIHANTYEAFRYRDEGDIYDALAVSIDGELLRDVYLQVRRGLAMREQGGAISRVRHVEIIDGQRQAMAARSGSRPDELGFAYRCRWNVTGTVEHWGHVHERTNQYEALFTIAPIKGAWKVTQIGFLDEQRLEFETRLRRS